MNETPTQKIVLTDKALEIYKQIGQHIDSTEKLLSKGISNDELSVFYGIIDKIKVNLEVSE